MYQMGGAQEEVSYREIFVNRSSDKWKEITVNTGGIASTLQDVKAHQRCGGYVYQKQNNRFIYWRTSDEVLELVEDSLDVDLTGSQLRLRFSGSHVLEGVSIAETANSVVILVPTVSSVHRFMFPHPERLLKQGVKHPLSKSIFCDANEADASDPNSYHVLSSNPSAILTGASYLTVRSEAVFALSMANSSIHVITMDLLSGTAIVTVLNNDSVLPRFLGNIMGALLRNKDNNAIFGAGGGSEGSCVSMVLHTFNRELYLFSLEREGQLRVWLCSKASYLMTETLVENSDIRTLKGQNHKLRKGFNSKGELILCAHLQGSTVVVLKPVFESGVFRFSKLSLMSPPPNLEMVDMTLGGGGSVWCSWLTGQELPMVTQFKIPVSNWASVDLVKPQLEVNQTPHFVMDPAQLHLDALFSSGFFTAHDICKALSVYRTSTMVDPTADIREQICSIVESEIYSEIGDAAVDDDEFLEISQRSWSRLYSCCIQFLVSGITPVGLFWLPSASCLVLIKPHGFSLVREITPLEMAYLGNSNDTKDGYGKLLQCLRMIDMDEPIERLDLALHLGESVQSCIEEAAKLIPQSKALTEAIGIISRDDFGQSQGIMETLINELRSPEEFDRPEPEGDSFCSESGISAVVATFRDMCRLRLEICLKTALVLRLVSPSSEPRGLSERLAQLSRTYHFLRWTCTTNVSLDTPLVASFALAHTSLMLPSIVDSALSLANTLWPENESDLLPRHLLATKNYVLLDTMARLVGCGSWTVIMVKSYLETGEANKAYDLVMSWSEATTSYFLKMAAIFEQYRQPDLVIAIASKAISVSNPTPGELETLHSMLFLHELQLGHYEAAYSWVKTISACAGTAGGSHSDCLHHLILDMLANGRLRELLSFPYMGLLNQLERMLESRARTMPIESASTYYDLLYALHVKHDNFKKAASIMFEHGIRSETVDTQWRCYGACLMTIMLVDPEQAWVVKPTGTVDPNQDTIEVLEVNDIRREYELARARVQLGNCPTDSSASEVISQCIRSGRYKYAMRLAALCRSSCAPVIEAFTAACVVLTESKSAPWQWVRHNEIGNIMVTEQNAVDMAWCILERLIMSYERPNETLLHRTAANKLMELARFLPTWLLVSYKKKNASELLRLYLRHGHLQQASDLACDYLKAGLGWGKEDFSMETPLLSTAPPLCLPISCIDLLILELKEYKMEEELQSMLSKYVETAKRVSQDKAIAVK